MNNILIVWVGTGLYRDRFKTFDLSLSKFCPGIQKDIHVYSDLKNKTGIGNPEKYTRILHSNWPIIALEKFNYIIDAISEVYGYYTHVFYFNSNIKFVHECPKELFLTDKIIAVHNIGWDKLGHDPIHFTYERPLQRWISERRKIESACYIDGWYDYCASGLFGGPINLMYKLCMECNNMLKHDLANNFIPVFHDETAFNKWVNDHKDQVTILNSDWMMDEDRAVELLHPNPHIVLTNSDNTQFNYKEKYYGTI